MAIAPELEALDKALAKAQKTARGVLDELEADSRVARHARSRRRQCRNDRPSKRRRSSRSCRTAARTRRTRSSACRSPTSAWRTSTRPATFLEGARIGRRRPRDQRSRRLAAFGPGSRAGRRAARPIRARTARVSIGRVGRDGQEDVPGVSSRTRKRCSQTQDSDPTRYNRKMAEFELGR